MDFGTTATNDRTHTPELPMLEPTHPQTFDLLELSKQARAMEHTRAAFVLLLANNLVHDLSRGVAFGRASVDLDNAITEWLVRWEQASGSNAALLSFVSLAVEAGALRNGESVGCSEIDGLRPEMTPESAFADMRTALAAERDDLPMNKMRCKRLEQAYLDLRAIVSRSKRRD